MIYSKRLWIALIFGLLTGLVCGLLGISQIKPEYKAMIFFSAFLNRGFIGFVIGISCWRIGWLLHGVLIGLIGSLPMSFPLLFNPNSAQASINPETAYSALALFIMCTVAGIVWGFIIELFTTIVFKAPMKVAEGK
jgi:hypothetical protein